MAPGSRASDLPVDTEADNQTIIAHDTHLFCLIRAREPCSHVIDACFHYCPPRASNLPVHRLPPPTHQLHQPLGRGPRARPLTPTLVRTPLQPVAAAHRTHQRRGTHALQRRRAAHLVAAHDARLHARAVRRRRKRHGRRPQRANRPQGVEVRLHEDGAAGRRRDGDVGHRRGGGRGQCAVCGGAGRVGRRGELVVGEDV